MTDSPSSRLAAARSHAHPSPARSGTVGATSAGRHQSGAPSLAAGYPGLHELVEERLFPFMQQVVGFLGIGWVASTSIFCKQAVHLFFWQAYNSVVILVSYCWHFLANANNSNWPTDRLICTVLHGSWVALPQCCNEDNKYLNFIFLLKNKTLQDSHKCNVIINRWNV